MPHSIRSTRTTPGAGFHANTTSGAATTTTG
jgi:hypothetical protein